MSGSESLQNVATLFFGGPDDREALEFSKRLGMYHHENLTIIRFLPTSARRELIGVNFANQEKDVLMAIPHQENDADAVVLTDFYNSAEVPAIFIFGDSTADVGTNNYLKGCKATANNRYYGIDYPCSKPTGRFSNGFNTIDYVVRQLGDLEESPPPYLYLLHNMSYFKSNILRGVNFASGGAGILNRTGSRAFKNVVSLEKQIEQFGTVKRNISELLGEANTETLLANSMYIITVGSNDLFDYFHYDLKNYSAVSLLANLTITYTNHLQKLYSLGARKFGIVSIPPVGCVPAVRVYTGGVCLEQLNELAQLFYIYTSELLRNFTSSSRGVKYSLGNAYRMTINIIDNPLSHGFKNARDACCGVGAFNGEDKCTPKSKLCHKRKHFFFWDWFHPTQYVSYLVANALVRGESKEIVTPINFRQLASL
ncbi:hypothetical protein ACH5RR_011924 [Cinchona calisaya]|uniref:GDSL esterase/lipase n=1 Tax=Cinchona calisaya TaxID=153742 RepID=A0ABD3AC70_9GENT